MSHTHHIDRPDGTRIAYSVSGAAQATPLILSNSLATDARMWEKVLPELQAKFRVITYDTRGHGQSVCAQASPTLSDLADDLTAVMDAAGAPKALLAGVSLGGMTVITALALAGRVPHLPRRHLAEVQIRRDAGRACRIEAVTAFSVAEHSRLRAASEPIESRAGLHHACLKRGRGMREFMYDISGFTIAMVLLVSLVLAIEVGQRVDRDQILRKLVEIQYERNDTEFGRGTFRVRGDIVEIFPSYDEYAVRIELWGDEIESIREFDPHNQLTRDKVESVTLPPAGELGLLKKSTLNEAPGAQPAIPQLATFLEHLPTNAILLLCQPDSLHEQALKYRQQVAADDPFFCPWDEVLAEAARRGMACIELDETEPGAAGVARF